MKDIQKNVAVLYIQELKNDIIKQLLNNVTQVFNKKQNEKITMFIRRYKITKDSYRVKNINKLDDVLTNNTSIYFDIYIKDIDIEVITNLALKCIESDNSSKSRNDTKMNINRLISENDETRHIYIFTNYNFTLAASLENELNNKNNIYHIIESYNGNLECNSDFIKLLNKLQLLNEYVFINNSTRETKYECVEIKYKSFEKTYNDIKHIIEQNISKPEFTYILWLVINIVNYETPVDILELTKITRQLFRELCIVYKYEKEYNEHEKYMSYYVTYIAMNYKETYTLFDTYIRMIRKGKIIPKAMNRVDINEITRIYEQQSMLMGISTSNVYYSCQQNDMDTCDIMFKDKTYYYAGFEVGNLTFPILTLIGDGFTKQSNILGNHIYIGYYINIIRKLYVCNKTDFILEFLYIMAHFTKIYLTMSIEYNAYNTYMALCSLFIYYYCETVRKILSNLKNNIMPGNDFEKTFRHISYKMMKDIKYNNLRIQNNLLLFSMLKTMQYCVNLILNDTHGDTTNIYNTTGMREIKTMLDDIFEKQYEFKSKYSFPITNYDYYLNKLYIENKIKVINILDKRTNINKIKEDTNVIMNKIIINSKRIETQDEIIINPTNFSFSYTSDHSDKDITIENLHELNEIMKIFYSEIYNILIKSKDLILAGGFFSSIFYDTGIKDYDLFVINNADMYNTANNLYKQLKTYFNNCKPFIIYKQDVNVLEILLISKEQASLITDDEINRFNRLIINKKTTPNEIKRFISQMKLNSIKPIHRFQLITRKFYNVDEIFNNFDLPICKIATNGNDYYFTKKALHSLQTKTIYQEDMKTMSNIKYRIKRYEEKGFKFIIKDMDKLNNMCSIDKTQKNTKILYGQTHVMPEPSLNEPTIYNSKYIETLEEEIRIECSKNTRRILKIELNNDYIDRNIFKLIYNN